MASDFNKVDAHVNGPADYEDIPELTEGDFSRGAIVIGGEPVKRSRGRPAPNGTKQQVTLRLDPAVIQGFKATGEGWQRRMNDVLRDWLAMRQA